jgi:hypothetical protein
MREPNRERKSDIKYNISLNEEQKQAKQLILENQITIITGQAGCLGIDTEVLMFDGTFKKVQDVVVGDRLMGTDSTPRNVLELKRGVEQMYWVRQKKGDDYRVNESHILSLKRVQSARYPRVVSGDKRNSDFSRPPIHDKKISTVNITVNDFLKLKNRKQYMGYISPCIHFDSADLLIEPYYLGLWLGDGSKRDIKQITNIDTEIIEYLNSFGCDVHTRKHDNASHYFKDMCIELNDKFLKIYGLTNIASLKEKYIPKDYLYNSKENRLQLLAGLIDSDGHYSNTGKYYEITQKNKMLSEQIAFLSRSLGFKTNIRTKTATMKRADNTTYSCEVYRITFMPNEILPVKINRKKNEISSDFKDRSHTGITVEKDCVDNYYGFALDGDNLFLLKDLTVTHNTGKSLVGAITALDFLNKKMSDKILVTRAAIEVGKSLGFLPGELSDKYSPYIEALIDNLNKCTDKQKVIDFVRSGKIEGLPVQYIRGKTIDDILIVEESQNLSPFEMEAILTRLGKTGKIIINGDNQQRDTQNTKTGLDFAIELSKNIEGIAWIKLKENHRSGLVGKILDFIYG